MNSGILLVSFGTTHRDTREKNIEAIVEAVRKKYPDRDVCQAYSSDRVRAILKERENLCIPSIEEALIRMKESGIRNLTILPTHIIDGVENNKMKQIAERYRPDFETLSIADALLEEEEDYSAAAKALWDSLKEAAQGKTVIFMGHGSQHEADGSYEKMEQALRAYAGREIYIATVEGAVTIEEVLCRMERCGQSAETSGQAVLLAPFMLVAGEHAVNDMAGEKASFASKARAAGMDVTCLMKGLGEYEGIVELYMKHLKRAEEHGR